jgi:hypothetical protein
VQYHVIVTPEVVQAVGEIGLSRNAIVILYTTLHDDLGNRGGQYRTRRHPDEPDLYFAYRARVTSGGLWHQFDFAVDDVTAPETFIVLAVSHISRPL